MDRHAMGYHQPKRVRSAYRGTDGRWLECALRRVTMSIPRVEGDLRGNNHITVILDLDESVMLINGWQGVDRQKIERRSVTNDGADEIIG